MPHVVVKLWPGRNDEIKTNLAKRIANVVVEELIPEASQGEHSNNSTIGFGLGFILMMILDVAN